MARFDSLWLDSDVILDWLTKRQPWDAGITELVERAGISPTMPTAPCLL